MPLSTFWFLVCVVFLVKNILLLIREMQIKTTIRYTPTRMTKMKKTDNAKRWQGFGATGTLIPSDGTINYFNYFGKLFGNIS